MGRFFGTGILVVTLAVHAGCTTCSQRPQYVRDRTRPVYVSTPARWHSRSRTPRFCRRGASPPTPSRRRLAFVQPGQEPPSIASPPPGVASRNLVKSRRWRTRRRGSLWATGSRRTETQWQPAEAKEPAPRVDSTRDAPLRVNLYAPEPEKEAAKDNYYLGPPQIDKDRKPANDPSLKKPGVTATFPAIPQFAVVKDNIYAGLRPKLDGLDWLQTNAVKTVIRVSLYGEDDSADRKQVEIRDMHFVAFEVSAQTLTKAKIEEFIKLVGDAGKQGVFCYDKDGSLAGAMWYLYLRHAEFLDDDSAQVRARPLGLQTNLAGQHRDMWIAVQKLLSENDR